MNTHTRTSSTSMFLNWRFSEIGGGWEERLKCLIHEIHRAVMWDGGEAEPGALFDSLHANIDCFN